MKYSIAVALFAVLCAAGVRAEDVCHAKVKLACQPSTTLSVTGGVCNARYGGIDNIQPEVQAIINFHLTKSYEYLLMATNFNSYQKNRPGFEKLYRSLSDRSFEDTINLIKQVTRRGGKVDFAATHAYQSTASAAMELDELHSLAVALDSEKKLADATIHVHTHATHGTRSTDAAHGTRATHTNIHDPEMSQYLEEKFLTSQAESIRKLSGYVNDLSKIMNNSDPSLGVYLFDEYLQKQ